MDYTFTRPPLSPAAGSVITPMTPGGRPRRLRDVTVLIRILLACAGEVQGPLFRAKSITLVTKSAVSFAVHAHTRFLTPVVYVSDSRNTPCSLTLPHHGRGHVRRSRCVRLASSLAEHCLLTVLWRTLS